MPTDILDETIIHTLFVALPDPRERAPLPPPSAGAVDLLRATPRWMW